MSITKTVKTIKDNVHEPEAPKYLSWLLVIGGTIALICAFIIMLEKIQIYQNPNYIPSCNLNPVISCGSVMRAAQAHVFGFPNPIVGLVGFPVLITTGAAMLAGARFKRWFWLAINLGLLFAVIFCHYLIFQTIYRIGALCPYCMGVWAVTVPMFWYVTLHNIKTRTIRLPKNLSKLSAFAANHHAEILTSWYVILLLLILKRFWYYWSSL